MESSPSESAGAKAAFRKPSNDSANRKYRRRSPVSDSSDSDGESVPEHTSAPTPSRNGDAKLCDNRERRDDKRDVDRDHRRSHYSRDGDSYRNPDRSSRTSYNHHRHEDYSRRERRESNDHRSRDTIEKYSRDKSDGSGHRIREKDREASSLEYLKHRDSSFDRGGSGRRHANFDSEEVGSGERERNKRDGDGRNERKDYPKTSRNRKSERSPSVEESRGHRTGPSLKESPTKTFKEIDGHKYHKDEKEKYYGHETDRRKERNNKESRELLGDRTTLGSNDEESLAKKPKLFVTEKDMDKSKDASKHLTSGSVVQSLSSKQGPEFVDNGDAVQHCVKESDIDAAKIAAMKAAELVNRNLVGTGYMSTDQKKKLLWGSKKSAATEETANRWDTSMFSDRERQEKFKKLMGVKGDVKLDQKPENQGGNLAEKQKELQLDLEKQYTAGLRRRDGRTVGLGL